MKTHGNPHEECFSWGKTEEFTNEENIPRDFLLAGSVMTNLLTVWSNFGRHWPGNSQA